MSGIAESLIAAIIYSVGRHLLDKTGDPLQRCLNKAGWPAIYGGFRTTKYASVSLLFVNSIPLLKTNSLDSCLHRNDLM